MKNASIWQAGIHEEYRVKEIGFDYFPRRSYSFTGPYDPLKGHSGWKLAEMLPHISF
jgi:hypothetical protein